MATRWYPAIVEHGDAPGYSVFFPDLAGCVSAGDNLQDTANQAADALALHVRGMLEDGTALPPPSTLDNVNVDSEVREIGRILVPVELPGRSLRINITMDEALVAQVDRAASKLGISRSGLLALGARKVIETECGDREQR